MATRSVVAYQNSDGDVRGTYVHYDGNPEFMVPDIKKMLVKDGFDALVNWIEMGILGQGYESFGDKAPFNDGGEPWVKGVNDEEYGYLIDEKTQLIEVFDNH